MPPTISRATLIGDGAMGTLCALLLADHGTRVTLWGRSSEHVATLQRDRRNRRYLPDCVFPDSIAVTHDPAPAFDSPALIVSAVPCQFLRSVWTALAPYVPADTPIVSVTKGIEVDTLLLPTAILRECVGTRPVACLSGPCIAPEVAAKRPATVVVAADRSDLGRRVQGGFSTGYFRVYTSGDLLGVELAAAVKNVIAIAAGISDGLELGDNAKASLITRGLVEITRLGVALGASAETFRGLAGMGDLITTCTSKIGRNRSAGVALGHGHSVDDIIAATPSVIEGIPTTRSVLRLAEQRGVEMPIVSGVASVLFDGKDPLDAINELMTRPLHDE